MKQPSLAFGALIGGLTIIPVIALMYLGMHLAGLPFVPFDLFDWLARVLPGSIIVHSIDAMVRLIRGLHLGPTSSVAKNLEQFNAILLVVGFGYVIGALIALAMRLT